MLTGGPVLPVPSPLSDSDGVVISGKYDEAYVCSCSWSSTTTSIGVGLEGPMSTTTSGPTLSPSVGDAKGEGGSGIASVNRTVFRLVQGQKSDLSYR